MVPGVLRGCGQWGADLCGGTSASLTLCYGVQHCGINAEGALNAPSPPSGLFSEVGAAWGSTGTPFLQAQPWGSSAAGQRCPMSCWPRQVEQRAMGQLGCGFAMSITEASAVWVLVLIEEAEDAQGWS